MKTTREISNKALAQLIEYAHANKGTVVKLIAECERISGLTFARQQIEPYLHPDLKKRVEPRLGMGMLLIQAWGNLQLAIVAEKRKEFADESDSLRKAEVGA